MSKQNLQTLLQRIGETVGIPDLSLDDDNVSQLRVDGALDIMLEFFERTEQVVFTVRCGELGQNNRNAMLQEIAEANFHWIGGGGGTLSLNAEDGMVYLQFREPTAQLDQTRFEGLLQALIMNAEHWGTRLVAGAVATDKPSALASEPATFNSLIPNRA